MVFMPRNKPCTWHSNEDLLKALQSKQKQKNEQMHQTYWHSEVLMLARATLANQKLVISCKHRCFVVTLTYFQLVRLFIQESF